MNMFEKHLGASLIVIFIAIVGLVTCFNWYASCRSAQMYDKLNGASFTCSDFFWAGDQINSTSQTVKIK